MSAAELAATGGATTPTGLDSNALLRRRRVVVLVLNLALLEVLALWLAAVLGVGGWSVVDVLMMAAFLVAAPWTVLGFWNALIGFWLLHGRRDGLAAVAPYAAAGDAPTPLHATTAVLMTLRNEDPSRAIARLEIVEESIEATGEGARFAYFILSDTSSPQLAEAEEQAVAAWRARSGHPHRITYRRRTDNAGFKAGNVRDFIARWGDRFDLMLPLDADSLMAGPTIVRLARMMQAHPRIGILQSLVVGAPSASAFARIFQFGMRAGMRSYTMGAAWWAGDCGPFWGHNALVRIAPFAAHCECPVLPGKPPLGGHILSHDQVEAVLMRRAGYEIRVLPVEGGSWEENPPTLLDFLVRDQRWCQGNLQYLRLLALPGLKAMSRFQLAWAILMFLGIPATTIMVALAPLKLLDGEDLSAFPGGAAVSLYLTFLLLNAVPKLAGFADILARRGGAQSYGGVGKLLTGAALETVVSQVIESVSRLRVTVFMAGLAFGRSVLWSGQERDAYGLRWPMAFAALWPSLVFAALVCGSLAILAPSVLLWSLPLTLGHLVAMPFAVATASPGLGRALARAGLCAIPEERDPPPEILALKRPFPSPGWERGRGEGVPSPFEAQPECGSRARSASPIGGTPSPPAPLPSGRGGMGGRPRGTAAAVGRSLRLYYGDPAARQRMDALYARFVRPGDLVFDVGAHVGDRIASFRRLGARVVALEPQPGPARALALIHGRDPGVRLIQAAAAAHEGAVSLAVNHANPTVTTASPDFVRAAAGAAGWEGQVWDGAVSVPATTLDALVAAHGRPAFAKIDVEGFEAAVLQGLSTPLPALSFEFTTIAREIADACLDRLVQLGPYRFDLALGESQTLTFGRFVEAPEMAAHLAALPHAANSGDVYAVLHEE